MIANDVDTLFDKAANLFEQGKFKEAEQHCHSLCATHPYHAPAVSLMGAILCQTNRAKIGVKFLEKAIELAPNEAAYFNNLGVAYTNLKRLNEALCALQRAIALAPHNPNTHNNIGAVLRPLGRLTEAEKHYAIAADAAPGSAQIWANYANILMELDQVSKAEIAAQKAITNDPEYPIAHNNFGTVLQRQGKYSAAEAHYCSALALRPNYADAHANMGELLKETGRVAESLFHYERACKLEPEISAMGSNKLLAICTSDCVTPPEISAAHFKWGDQVASGVDISRESFQHNHQKLRIGYVSPDFRRHSVAYFLEPILKNHNHIDFEVFCYANMSTDGDDITRKLRAYVDRWLNVFGIDDQALAARVRQDEIDILVDVAGHTRGNRLPAFALRPAPIQMSYLGYPATTGLSVMDYRLTDTLADPPGLTEILHRETLLNIEGGFLSYNPQENSPDVGYLPAHTSGFITFGSFNNLAKVTPTVISIWSKILTSVPRSKLVIKSKALGDEKIATRIKRAFAHHGINSDRIQCLGWITQGSPLIAYNQIDIGLDTFPYNGTTTTCEALWMGIPVITLAGKWHAARVGVSVMTRLNLADWIASDENSYVTLAVKKTQNLLLLEELRFGMRQRMKDRGLLNGQKFTRSLEAVYRQAWAVRETDE